MLAFLAGVFKFFLGLFQEYSFSQLTKTIKPLDLALYIVATFTVLTIISSVIYFNEQAMGNLNLDKPLIEQYHEVSKQNKDLRSINIALKNEIVEKQVKINNAQQIIDDQYVKLGVKPVKAEDVDTSDYVYDSKRRVMVKSE